MAFDRRLRSLLQNIAVLPDALADLSANALVLDSRAVKSGDVFIALAGTQVDGRQFIPSALQQGAIAVLAENAPAGDALFASDPRIIVVTNLRAQLSEIAARFYAHPARNMRVIGITGTNGKTTISQLIGAALNEIAGPTYVAGTLGYGMVGELIAGRHTTPDAIAMQACLADAATHGAQFVSMEVSSHGLEQGRVAALPFASAIFTNLTRDHLDYHLTMENYGAAKRRLFVWPNLQHAIINADDAFGAALLADPEIIAKKFAYSLRHAHADAAIASIYAERIHYSHDGILAEVVTPWGRRLLQSPLLGEFNLSNLLAALTTLCANGFALDKVANALGRIRPINGRMERFGGGQNPLIVVDYAHTPDALEKAIMALRLHCSGSVTVIFGCGGDRDKGKRAQMGAIAQRLAEHVIISNDNPRSESPQAIADDIRAGMNNGAQVLFIADREQALRTVLQSMQHGDAVLLAGKGHETYTEIMGQRLPYSEVAMVQKVLQSGVPKTTSDAP